MKEIKRSFRNTALAVILAAIVVVMPVAATVVADFDWDVYRINTDDWEDYSDYNSYEGTIYEVHFYDESSGSPTSWKWYFSEDDWSGSTEENPVHIYTEDEVDDDDNYPFKVSLAVSDGSTYNEITQTVYVTEDAWNLKDIYDLTPEPTATPTTVPTTSTPTPEPTTETPTPEPTVAAAFTLDIPVISDEIIKLQIAYEDNLEVIFEIFKKIGIMH